MLNKIPKIYIYPSYLGFYLIKRNLWDKEWKKLKLAVKEFNDFFQKYEKSVVKLIAKYMAADWAEDKINVWFFSPIFSHPSISSPLLVKLRKDFQFTTYILIHELIHAFFQSNKLYSKFKPSYNSNYNADILDDFIAYKIFKDLFGEKELIRIKKFKHKTWTTQNFKEHEIKIQMLEKRIDLNKKPFYQWVKIIDKLVKINDSEFKIKIKK